MNPAPEDTGASPPSKALTASEKSKIRRAQVRRAQIQHRKRKAEYVKQLELDVTHFRELIALAEDESAQLEKANSAMRDHLKLIGINVSVPLPNEGQEAPVNMDQVDYHVDSILASGTDLSTVQPPTQIYSLPQESQREPELFGDVNLDEIIVRLSKDEGLTTPVFSIRSNSSDSSFDFAKSNNSTASSPPSSVGAIELSREEEQMAINFILALEHICWDHFWLGDYPDHEYHSDEFKGHTLMASTFCMASAPEEVYRGRKDIASASECSRRRALGMNPYIPAVFYEWPSPQISLSSLHGLASSLNPGDKELTPIQAWFELADRFPKDVLLNPETLHRLSRELNGVVVCLEFGAVIEREAFESVVGRILGPNLDTLPVWPAIPLR
ncbi:hypothetical protein BGZ63DRAFT_120101 [Mariannaea sp. PMI_226]|nr:hypothetical protein BGZ63DRAFT_120101 [Mariannaea sp. PMI_226]